MNVSLEAKQLNKLEHGSTQGQLAGVNISQNSWIIHPGKVSLFWPVREEFHILMIHAFCRKLHFGQKNVLNIYVKQKLSAVFEWFLT